MGEIMCLLPQIGKVIKKKGAYGRKPSLGCKCLVKLKVESGELPNEASDYLPADAAHIIIGDGNWPIDKAIESCIETMNLYEESVFEVKLSENACFNLWLSLESCCEKGYIFQWSEQDKLEASKLYKSDGVTLFKNNRIDHAFYKFSKALKMLLLMDSDLRDVEDHPEGNDILISLYNNLANCQFHFKNYQYVIELCTKSLSFSPNVKGYFRRALAFIELKEYENAENDLLGLLKLEPKNKAAIEKYKLVRLLDKQNRDNYEAIVRNMFRC